MNRYLPLLVALIPLAGCGSMPTAPSNPGPSNSSLKSNAGTGAINPGANLPADAPAWIANSDKHPSYASVKFMTATGIADARDPAIDNGRATLVKELNSDIQAVTEVFEREVSVGDEALSSLDFSARVRNQGEALLRGTRAVDEYRHGGLVYVLVVLDREKHANAALKQLDLDLGQLSGAESTPSDAGRLRTLIEDLVILDDVAGDLLNIGIVLRKGHPLRAESDRRMAQVTARTKAARSELQAMEVTVRPVGGMGQRGNRGETLAERITFEAKAGGRPVAGFPVTFALEHSDRAEVLEADEQTDSNGRFSCAITGIQLTGEEENDVMAALDFEELGEVSMKAPGATISFLLPTLKSATFSIAIEETNISKINPESVVRAAIEAGLGERGAKTVKLGTYLSDREAKEAATASPSWVKGKLEGKVDYLVRGTARSVVSSTRGSIVYSYAGGDFELIDVRTGVQVAALTMAPAVGSGSKGTANHEFGSGASALRKLGAKVKAEFMAKIDGAFLVE